MRNNIISQIDGSTAVRGLHIPSSTGALMLSGDGIKIAVNAPGAPGTYCGSRFSWAGIIAHVDCHGHRFFGPWRPGNYPLDEHDNVTGTAGEFGMGIAGMPPPLGFDDAVTGGHFVKIGVGVLCRPDEKPYSFTRRYEIADAPGWQVKRNEHWIDMRQTLAYDGYGYDYSHRIELLPGSTSFLLRHSLTNTGRKTIRQTHYSHNFLVIDQRPVGPAYEMTFPFTPECSFGPDSIAYVEGNNLKFRKMIPADSAVFTQLSGFGSTSADNKAIVRHRDAGVEVRISGDRPLTRYHLFAVRGAVCPEPFVNIMVVSGETATWLYRYDFCPHSS